MTQLLSFCMLPFRSYDMFIYMFAIITVTALFNLVWNLIK